MTAPMFRNPAAECFVPDQRPVAEALSRTTHLGIAAHPDDLEIMAQHGIVECFQRPDQWFAGVVVTDGAGSPRSGPYAAYDDATMVRVRAGEQRKAAYVGEYGAQVLLGYPSRVVKQAGDEALLADLVTVLRASRPNTLYVHNLADKHDTHVGLTLRVLEACRSLSAEERPERLLGCEVWRDLDWMPDADKVLLDCSRHPSLGASLVGVFDSQITGGKRYDLAIEGRRRANATFFESHGVDEVTHQTFAMDLTPLLADGAPDAGSFVRDAVLRFAADVSERLGRVQGPGATPGA